MFKQPTRGKWIWSGATQIFLLSALLLEAADTNQVVKSADDLENFTLEQLVNVQVTSVSKKETDLFTAPSAIYVITQEDIRRSGMTSIPEALRMVPGLDVAQIDANHWAISSRGFNQQSADKLLVLIDGRSVYSPVNGGVFWNAQDMPLDDIDRIEIIRGPGAALWGANAVNGVINIISKSAKDTQGGLVTVTCGNEEQPGASIRYGGQLMTNLFYRAYLQYFNRTHFDDSMGQSAGDGWDAIHGGLRMDWDKSTENNFTLQGDIYQVAAGETVDETTLTPPYVNHEDLNNNDTGGNVLGRWTHNFSDTSQLNLQMYYDHSQEEEDSIDIKSDTYDFDLQHRFAMGTRNDIILGAGYRYLTIDSTPNFFVSLTPPDEEERLYSTFVQDEITAVRDRLHLIIGTKLEHNPYTGFEVEPSGRLAWTPTEKQTVWAAVSRAVRTPFDFEQYIRENRSYDPPVLVSVFGDPNLKSEELTAFELGYRIKPIEPLSFDVTAFYNVYNQLIEPVQGTPFFEAAPIPHLTVPLTFENVASAQTYGTELLGEWRVTPFWKLTASYSLLLTHQTPPLGYDNNPENQFQIHSYIDLPHHVELDGAVYYVDQISPVGGTMTTRVPSYVRVDFGVTWRPIKSLELGIFGQNLAAANHTEFTSYTTSVVTEIPRSVMGRITWSF